MLHGECLNCGRNNWLNSHNLCSTCASREVESPSTDVQQLKQSIALVRKHGNVHLSEGYPRQQLENYLVIIEQRACV